MIVRVTVPDRTYRIRAWRERWGVAEDGEMVKELEFDRTVVAPAYVVVPDDLDQIDVVIVWPDAPLAADDVPRIVGAIA